MEDEFRWMSFRKSGRDPRAETPSDDPSHRREATATSDMADDWEASGTKGLRTAISIRRRPHAYAFTAYAWTTILLVRAFVEG